MGVTRFCECDIDWKSLSTSPLVSFYAVGSLQIVRLIVELMRVKWLLLYCFCIILLCSIGVNLCCFCSCNINIYMFIIQCLSSDHFQVIPLSFSRNLDRFNPNIPEWRRDVGQVVTKILAKVLVSIINTQTLELCFMQNNNFKCTYHVSLFL